MDAFGKNFYILFLSVLTQNVIQQGSEFKISVKKYNVYTIFVDIKCSVFQEMLQKIMLFGRVSKIGSIQALRTRCKKKIVF